MLITVQYVDNDTGKTKTDMHTLTGTQFPGNRGMQSIHELTRLVSERYSNTKILRVDINFEGVIV